MQNSAGTVPLSNKVEVGLVRAIGTGTLAASIVNLVIGAGIFALPALVVAEIGTAAPFAYLLCSILVGLVFLCFAEAGSRVAGSGGAYACVEAAFGPLAGFLVSTLLWFGVGVLSCAAISNVIADTLASVWPWTGHLSVRFLLLFLLFGGLAAINVAGVRSASRFVVLNTAVKLVPLLIFVATGLPAIDWDNLALETWPPLENLGATSLLLFFAFGGAELALTPSGEVQDPPRTVPRAILLGLGGVLGLYISVQGVAQGVLGPELAQHRGAPLAAAAERVLGSGGRFLLVLGASLSIFATLSGSLLATPRALFAAAEDGLLPARLAAIHPRFRTPHIAIIVFAALSYAFAITGTFRALAVVSSASVLLIYFAVSLSVLGLRRRNVQATQQMFCIPGGPFVPLLSCGVVLWLLSHAARAEVLGLSLLLLVASAVYGARLVWRKPTRSTQRRC
jgi:basic amino acid/polyamine antiporter, APA family